MKLRKDNADRVYVEMRLAHLNLNPIQWGEVRDAALKLYRAGVKRGQRRPVRRTAKGMRR